MTISSRPSEHWLPHQSCGGAFQPVVESSVQTQKAVSLLLVVSLASFSLHLDTVDKGFGLQQDPSVTLHGGSCGENSVMTPDL